MKWLYCLVYINEKFMEKRLKIYILFVFFLTVCTNTIYPQNSNKLEIVDIYNTSTKPNLRPKMPDRQYITCLYDGESLYLYFTYGEGECLLKVTNTDTGEQMSYVFDSNESSQISIGNIDNGLINIYTQLNRSYEGRINIE